MRDPRPLQIAGSGWAPVASEVCSPPALSEEDVARVSADETEPRVSRLLGSVPVLVAAAVKIRAAAAIGGSSYNEHL